MADGDVVRRITISATGENKSVEAIEAIAAVTRRDAGARPANGFCLKVSIGTGFVVVVDMVLEMGEERRFGN